MLDQKDHIVAETAARIFADLADPQTINREKNRASKESLWQTLDDAKLPLAWVPERLGGSGASLAEGFAILGVAGRFALAVPLAETLASGWLLANAGLEAPPVETAGALEAILSLSVAYANERVAFERPIGKFQAVQQNLARLAGEVAAALAVSGSAADAIAQAESFDEGVFLEGASAKVRTAEAAREGAAIAHQAFGAIGFTQEHVLHRFTLRMLSWRDDFGNESYWAVELGKRIASRGADEFWPLMASR